MEGGTLQTNITGVCVECSQCLGHTGFAPAHSKCAFPVYTAQALGCSAGELSNAGPGLRALPRSKLFRFLRTCFENPKNCLQTWTSWFSRVNNLFSILLLYNINFLIFLLSLGLITFIFLAYLIINELIEFKLFFHALKAVDFPLITNTQHCVCWISIINGLKYFLISIILINIKFNFQTFGNFLIMYFFVVDF